MELFWERGLASLLQAISEEIFHAETNYDETTKKLTVSMSIGVRDSMNLKFYENYGGYPILVTNIPPNFWGIGVLYFLLFTVILKWRYGFIPKPWKFESEFVGYQFYGWKANSIYPMKVYLWNDSNWNMAKINQLILGLGEKEEQV